MNPKTANLKDQVLQSQPGPKPGQGNPRFMPQSKDKPQDQEMRDASDRTLPQRPYPIPTNFSQSKIQGDPKQRTEASQNFSDASKGGSADSLKKSLEESKGVAAPVRPGMSVQDASKAMPLKTGGPTSQFQRMVGSTGAQSLPTKPAQSMGKAAAQDSQAQEENKSGSERPLGQLGQSKMTEKSDKAAGHGQLQDKFSEVMLEDWEPVPGATESNVFYKLTGVLITKSNLTGVTENSYDMSGSVFLPKLVQVDESNVFLIGGSTDVKGVNPTNTCVHLDLSKKPPTPIQKAKMSSPRLSCGVALSQNRKNIYV